MICHVSFGTVKASSPEEWLKSVPYFTRILSKMAERHPVASVHLGTVTKTVSVDNVTYKFIKATVSEKLLLSATTEFVRSLNPEAIVLHGFHASVSAYRFVSVMKDFKIYIQHHGEKIYSFPKSFAQKRLDQHIVGYFFSSREIGQAWINARLIADNAKLLEVPEVTSSFAVAVTQRSRVEKLNFIWVGRLDANKDPITLIEGFISFLRIRPEANLFVIFQTTELLVEVQKRVKDFPSQIHLVGRVPHSEMSNWYTRADFVISTSLYEAGGVAVLEAMSCGCVPILSDIPSFNKIFSDGKIGALFQSGSPVALTEALVRAIEMDLSVERKKTLEYFEQNLSPAAIADKIVDITLHRQTVRSSVSL